MCARCVSEIYIFYCGTYEVCGVTGVKLWWTCVRCIVGLGVVHVGCVGGISMVYVWHMSVLHVYCLVCV